MPQQTIQSLVWQNYSSDASNLVCPISCDLSQFEKIVISTAGTFQVKGIVPATGVAIDNLSNKNPVTISVGPLVENVPAFQKSVVGLTEQYPVLTVTGFGTCLLTFFYGVYKGSPLGSNILESSKLAALSSRVGIIEIFGGPETEVPNGALLCDGAEYSRTTYAALFAKIGTRWGDGDGATTFNVPNFRRRSPVGADASGDRDLGTYGGVETVSLTGNQNGQHSHGVTDNGHAHGVSDPGHIHGVTQSPHDHGVTQTAHNHGVNDPLHDHGVSDPGHTHPVNDDGHAHTYTAPTGTGRAQGVDNTVLNSSGAATTSKNTAGIFLSARATGINIVTAHSGVTLNAANANININTANANISIASHSTGLTVNSAVTGITVNNSGTGAPHENMSPWAAVNFIIWYGAT